MHSDAEGHPLAIFGRQMLSLFASRNSFLHFFGVSLKVDSVRRRVSGWTFLCLGSTLEGDFCAQVRVQSIIFSFPDLFSEKTS